MSSADDTNPLIASPPASPSEHQPEESPIELEEVKVSPSILKPAIKTNMVAQEVGVRATGVRTGKSVDERELFTEETTSVLVSENSGVVCLSAAVAPGQLLLLTNEESKREVVAQVKRKRAYKPTSCYVELEFAEPAQRFWGREFSAATALLPKDARELEAAAMVFSAEAIADESGQPPAAPTPEEVQALKREVEALREQAKMTPAASNQALVLAPVRAAVTDVSPAPAPEDGAGPESSSTGGLESPPDVAFTAKSLPIEHEPSPAQLTAMEQVQPPRPALDSNFPRPKTKRSRRAKGSFTPGFRAGALRLALLTTALVFTVAGAAWYKHWIPWKSAGNNPSVKSPANVVNATTPASPVNPPAAKTQSSAIDSNAAHNEPAVSPSMPPRSVAPSETPVPEIPDIAERAAQPSESGKSSEEPAVRKTSPSPTPAAKRSSVPPLPRATSDSGAFVAPDVIVPPKLIKSVRAVATMDAVRDFETGSVVIDAVVGAEGKVESMNVLSGPPSLHDAAMQALKQYRYEPATRNGQPVPAHVTVTIRFRFEP